MRGLAEEVRVETIVSNHRVFASFVALTRPTVVPFFFCFDQMGLPAVAVAVSCCVARIRNFVFYLNIYPTDGRIMLIRSNLFRNISQDAEVVVVVEEVVEVVVVVEVVRHSEWKCH